MNDHQVLFLWRLTKLGNWNRCFFLSLRLSSSLDGRLESVETFSSCPLSASTCCAIAFWYVTSSADSECEVFLNKNLICLSPKFVFHGLKITTLKTGTGSWMSCETALVGKLVRVFNLVGNKGLFPRFSTFWLGATTAGLDKKKKEKKKNDKSFRKYLANEYFSSVGNVFGTAPIDSILGRLMGFVWVTFDKAAARDGMVTSSSAFVPTETIDPSKAESLLSSRCFKRWRMTTSPLTGTVGVLGNSESETEWDESPLPAKNTNHKQKFLQLQFLRSSKRHSYKQKKPPKQFVKRKRKRQI